MKHLLILPILLLLATEATAQVTVIAPGLGFHVESYDVSLRPDLTSKEVSGRETIIVTSTSDQLSQLVFSGNALQITDATVNGSPVVVISEKDAIIFPLRLNLAKSEKATLQFNMSGAPARGVNNIPGGLYTSYFACDWMVCLQDVPGDKADFDLDLIVPAGLVSVSVGREVLTKPLSDGLELHRWRSTRPYSPYVYDFAVGHFRSQSVQTGPGKLTYLNGTGAEADLSELFKQSSAIATFFSDKAGLSLPDHRYMQILVPGDDAQESANFSLIGEANLSKEREDPTSSWVIAHEMAHQWWGNLVTCATWKDLWLNEGITTFMVAAWRQHNDGNAAYRKALDVAQSRVDQARELGFDKPLTWEGKYPSLKVRRAIQYSKGAIFLARLREDIGERAFWKGLRLFTMRNAGGTVTSRDFQLAMESASGRDLSPMFKEWVYGDGSM